MPDTVGELATPIGVVRVTVRDGALAEITIHPDINPTADLPADPVLREAMVQLRDYFAGQRTRFDLPLAPAAMIGIPPGRTATYGQLAREIGSAPRAVGRACATNPLPILVPCHRVLPANGLGAYSGGAGPATKGQLLALEGVRLA